MCRLLRSQIGVCHETLLAPNGVMETLGWADTGKRGPFVVVWPLQVAVMMDS
jgi:hypothetical protein